MTSLLILASIFSMWLFLHLSEKKENKPLKELQKQREEKADKFDKLYKVVYKKCWEATDLRSLDAVRLDIHTLSCLVFTMGQIHRFNILSACVKSKRQILNLPAKSV